MNKLNIKNIEEKWQEKWKESGAFEATKENEGEKFYALDMYPYPSGSLHMGHVRSYSLGDVNARFRRMQGYNVMYPMGFDSFGLPAENAAIKRGENPRDWTEENIERIKKQMKRLGFSFDWSREIASHKESYYGWDQWIFVQLYKNDLIYKDSEEVNWCPNCKTVLANEQVKKNKCERCETEIEKKEKEQWFFKITEYSDELLEELNNLDWSKKVKKMQKDWIGRSHGIEIEFDFANRDGSLEVFTTRPDTLHGCTFMALAPEHPLSEKLAEKNEEIERFVENMKRLSEKKRKGKRGIDTGLKAINPLNGREIPIYISEFVLMEYGTGAIMSVPAHDQRDFEFAKKHDIDIIKVIEPESGLKELEEAYTGEGKLVNSGKFNGTDSKKAKKKMGEYLKKKDLAQEKTNYRLKDWNVSRQRYWGAPIPIIYCDECGEVPVPEENLPVELPKEDVEIDVEGSPLSHIEDFVNTQCPECGKKAKRETDTLDTFVDSAWYYLRFCSPNYGEGPFKKKNAGFWMPVDQYTGGIEHAVLHLLYARFFTKALADLNLIDFREPFKRLLNQGMILLDGDKMSKSKGNIVSPKEIIENYGADVARLFILSKSSPESEMNWTEEGVESARKLLDKFYSFFTEVPENRTEIDEPSQAKELKNRFYLSKLHQNLDKVGEEMKKMNYHYATDRLEKILNLGIKYKENGDEGKTKDKILSEYRNKLTLLFAPFTPHLAEELWQRMGNEGFVSLAEWPEPEEEKIDKVAESCIKLTKKVRKDVKEIQEITGIKNPSEVKIVVSSDWKYKVYRKTADDKDLSEIMENDEIKRRGNRAAGYFQELNKEHNLEELDLDSNEEMEGLKSMKDEIVEDSECVISIEKEEESSEDKAGKARPGKPAIVLKE